MKEKGEKQCYKIADQTVCQGDLIIVHTIRGTIAGKLEKTMENYIILKIPASKALIPKTAIIAVIVK